MKFIDKDELLDALEDYKDEFSGSYSDFKANARDALCRRVIATIIEDIVNEQPVVNPVKHGHWIFDPDLISSLLCSECDFHFHWINTKRPKFCPECGCKMDGVKNA